MPVYPRRRLTAVRSAAMVVIGALAVCPGTAQAEDTLRGKANIVDGDTIDIAGVPIRLDGIDAPEQRQTCTGPNSRTVACGELATKMLARMIGGATVTCVLRGTDSYRRLLGDCSVDGASLNARMVRSGWALAFVKYSGRYVSEEEDARAARAGLWQWQFDKPWDWRTGVLQEAAGVPDGSGGCVIKGNISGSGERIYHMPFHKHYGGTRIDPGKGERWFCTEDEAQAAGWRRALR
ncbi:thermonuclease family protein [Methyloceanibacter sp.]|uniref:thermonuclease family protein n=1 Tax=Methyloceanibacter sp. TaxID=1965321 RepID=UPI002C7C40E4|nr:thermonuclease family protein [Methyloceanibacter sp.]HML92938.1 thermonuclease family protein [Methyloceanibacter sp.]